GVQLLFGETSSESRFDLVARNLQPAHVAGCQSRAVLRRGSGSFVISGRHESPSALSIDSRQMAFPTDFTSGCLRISLCRATARETARDEVSGDGSGGAGVVGSAC